MTPDNFDILVISDGEEGKVTEYHNNLTDIGSDPYLKSFVQNGGGLIAIGAGAMYISSSCTNCMNWYPGTATQNLTNSTFQSIGNGYAQIQVTDNLFGFGLNDLYSMYVPYYAPNTSGNMIPIAKGGLDITADSLGDLQRLDKSGTPPAAPGRNNSWYDFKSNNTMDLTGFGINKSGSINSVMLKVKYSTRSGYNGTQYVKWSVDNGTTWNNTTIRPADRRRRHL